MQSFIGKCRFCGQENAVIAEDQEEANEIISADCYCGGAKREDEIKRKKAELQGRIDELTGPECTELNFMPLPDELREVLNKIGEAVVDGEIRQMSMKAYGTQITIRGGEKIKMTRSYKYEKSGEIQ